MNNKSLAYLIIFVLAILVLGLFYVRNKPIEIDTASLQQTHSGQTLDAPIVTYVNPSKGASNATLTIVEFGDFECSACADIQGPLEIALSTYPDDVRLVWKNMPNDSVHEQATPAAMAAHCAGQQGKFWEYHDELFARYSFLSETQYPEIAAKLELDVNKFLACFQTFETLPIVQKDFEEGQALGVSATPTLYVGDEILVGAVTLDRLIKSIQAQLATP